MRDTAMVMRARAWFGMLTSAVFLAAAAAGAQTAPPRATPAQAPPTAPPGGARPQTGTASTGLPISTDYTIGPDDVLGVVFWRDADMTQDVTVRPDGNITLPLIRDIKAAGLKPE